MTLLIGCGWTVYVFAEAVRWRALYAAGFLSLGVIAALSSVWAPEDIPTRTRGPAAIWLSAGGALSLVPVQDMNAHLVGIGLIALTIVMVTVASRRLEAP